MESGQSARPRQHALAQIPQQPLYPQAPLPHNEHYNRHHHQPQHFHLAPFHPDPHTRATAATSTLPLTTYPLLPHPHQQQQQEQQQQQQQEQQTRTATLTPEMITVKEHELVLRRIRESHQSTIRRMASEIEHLKAMLKKAKDSTKEVKRKAHEDLKDAIKEAKGRKRQKTPGNKHDAKWHTRYEELKAYKDRHGHCNVDKNDADCKDLWQWCQTQRTNYSNLVKGQETSMTSERLKLLNALRFQWVRNKTPALKWEERFEQLKEFKKKHGHVRIPQKLDEPKGLGNWVLEQRRRYREKNLPDSSKTSKKGPLSKEEIEKLESLGFEWSLRNRNGNSNGDSDKEEGGDKKEQNASNSDGSESIQGGCDKGEQNAPESDESVSKQGEESDKKE